MRFVLPSTIVCSGPSQAGKSYFVQQLCLHINEMMFPVPEEIIYCYSIWQPNYDKLRDDKRIKFIEGLPSYAELDGTQNRLLILDDLMTEVNETITNVFVKDSHHRNISVLQIVQNIFSKNKHQRTINLNSHYLILFRNPRDKSQISYIARQMYPGNTKFVIDAYNKATSIPHGYLLFDFRQETDEALRLRSSIFPGTLTEVYIPK